MKKTLSFFAQPLIRQLLDPRNQSSFWRLSRWGIGLLHPYLHFLYLYRSGSLLAAEKVAEKYLSRGGRQYKTVHQAKEMVAVLKNGRQPLKLTPCSKQSFNGRVVFALHSSLPWHLAGYAIRTQNLLQHLKYQGLRITAVTRPGFPWILERHTGQNFLSEDEVNGIRYQRLKDDNIDLRDGENTYIQRYASLLARLAQKQGANIIHASSNYLNGLAGAMAARQISALSVYEMRGLWHLSRSVIEPGYENSDHQRYCEIMEMAAAQESHAVVTLSQALKEHLVRKGVDDKKIHVLPNAVDTDYFSPIQPDQDLVRKLGIKGRVVVGFLGSLTGYEGLDLIIQAVSTMVRKGLPISLVIAGTGYAEKELKNLAKALSTTRHIHFVGQVPFEQIKPYYSIVDIFPFPRKNLPVCRLVPPLKILEAMAMGKAIIVSDLPPLMEMVYHENTGMVCRADDVSSLAEAIDTLAKSENLRLKLGESARDWTLINRSWRCVSAKYTGLFETLSDIDIQEGSH